MLMRILAFLTKKTMFASVLHGSIDFRLRAIDTGLKALPILASKNIWIAERDAELKYS